MRVIDTDASGACRGGETALDWNQKGQPGAQGPPGLAVAYGRSVGGPVALPDGGALKTVATLTVPRGQYAIFAKAVGSHTVPGYSCPPGTLQTVCVAAHNERRLAATIFGCALQAGTATDLGRANLIAGADELFASQTVSASVLEPLPGLSNTIRLRCNRTAAGKWPAEVTNVRLIAMKVDRVNPVGAFRAVTLKIPSATKKPKLRLGRKPQ